MPGYYKNQRHNTDGDDGGNRPFRYRRSSRTSSTTGGHTPAISNNEENTFPGPPQQPSSNTSTDRVISPKTKSTTTTSDIPSSARANERCQAWRPTEVPVWFSPPQTRPSSSAPSCNKHLRNNGSKSSQPSITHHHPQQLKFSPKRSPVPSSKTTTTTSSNSDVKHNTVVQEHSSQQYGDIEKVHQKYVKEEEKQQPKHSIWSDDSDDEYDTQVFSNIPSSVTTISEAVITHATVIDFPSYRSGWSLEPAEEERQIEKGENIQQYKYYFISHKREPRDLSIEDICVQSLIIQQQSKH